jgi:arabinan endo-1,5-alpha-L-arabinosidase
VQTVNLPGFPLRWFESDSHHHFSRKGGPSGVAFFVAEILPYFRITPKVLPMKLPKSFSALAVTSAITFASFSAIAQSGDVTRVHDPAIIKEGDTYYLFTTGRGVPVRTSKDLRTWQSAGSVFEDNLPAWSAEVIEGARNPWAPDISFFNDRFHLYYSISTFGSQRSLIGLATTATLDPTSPDFGWTDHGQVVDSQPGRDSFNAIDANVVLDDEGHPWLSWGSFHWGNRHPGGIMLLPLDPQTGRPPEDAKAESIAGRPGNWAIEAPFIVRRGDFFYLFVSFDYCCRGVASTYKIMVGRAEKVTGPYADREGVPMTDGGGTLVLEGAGDVRGPGHNDILAEDGNYWLVHHFYNAANQGVPTLQIRPLSWDEEGWPQAEAPITDTPHEN